MWEDQSIETCDDWVIPYIADLLATRLVPNLDARGWRLDVANTIYYRRRKGTVGVLEEIAANITGWDAKVVEFFRRMGRTRHLLDPPIGLAQAVGDDIDVLRMAEGLVGSRTRTGLGGLADLRDRYGATLSRSAFDEFAHTADVRLGQGNLGWHDIPRLGVFLWRLDSFGVGPTTPVRFLDCPDWATFDPTGRSIPLFAAGRTAEAYGSQWVSPQPWQMPGPIDQPLLITYFDELYQSATDPNSLAVLVPNGPNFDPVPIDATQILSELGRFRYVTSPPGGPVYTSYHYGFPSEIGAGPYDRRVLGTAALPTPGPTVPASGGGALPALPAVGTLEITDSLTYNGVPDVPSVQSLTIRASNLSRPLLRLPASASSPPGPPTAWTLTGDAGSTLMLDGLFVSGGDIVLAGTFDTVVLSCCTLDPGSAGAAQDPPVAGLYATAADGRPLVPCTLWIEAAVRQMCVDRSVTGPIRTRAGGNVDRLTVTDSILQAIPTGGPGPFADADIKDPTLLAWQLRLHTDPLSVFLYNHLSPSTQVLVNGSASSLSALSELTDALVADLNALLAGPLLYDPLLFAGVPLTSATLAAAQAAAAASPPAGGLVGLNRRLLEEAYRNELADAALAFTDGDTVLSRCTVLGPVTAHRIHVSECLLDDVAYADDTQDGCVRFSAWSDGSVLPRKYESVRIAPGAAVFTSADFGRPGFAQLLPTADLAILPSPPGADPNSYASSMIEGSSDGSEMGAFARDKNPIKQRGLLLKYQEFMPVGLVPVVVLVT